MVPIQNYWHKTKTQVFDKYSTSIYYNILCKTLRLIVKWKMIVGLNILILWGKIIRLMGN